jgi:opacity protein-like surface antigen
MESFIMKKFLLAAALVAAGALAAPAAALAQGYVVYGPPVVAVYPSVPAYGVYDYAPGYVTTYGYYPPVRWYGSFDGSGNSYRQPNPGSTIRAVR